MQSFLYADTRIAMTSSLPHTAAATHQHSDSTVIQSVATQNPPFKNRFKGRFEIIKRIGRGGFSTAYLANEVTASHVQPCVIKQLRYKREASGTSPQNEKLQAEHNQRRFQKEARIMARVGQHNQMPCLLDHFVDKGQFYLVQEHIPGLTLNQELHRDGPKNETQVKEFLRGMLPIIRYVHRHNLLHLDIKPANIIRRTSDQKLVLIDFGAVCRYIKDSQDSKPKRSSGTVGYASAEQLAGQPVPASDIYSLGVTCLYLLTGCSPLDFATSANGQNLRWQESVQVSDHMHHVLSRMLAPEAAQRFQSIDELERAMSLEGHYGELTYCLTREPFNSKRFKKPTACLLSDREPAPQSRSARQAQSIRRWQQRRQQFKAFMPK